MNNIKGHYNNCYSDFFSLKEIEFVIKSCIVACVEIMIK